MWLPVRKNVNLPLIFLAMNQVRSLHGSIHDSKVKWLCERLTEMTWGKKKMLLFFFYSNLCWLKFSFSFYAADEETFGEFPFKRGRAFHIGISISRESFNFFVNGQFFTYFNHRNDIHQLAICKCLAVNGAVLSVTNFKYYNNSNINFIRLTSLPF